MLAHNYTFEAIGTRWVIATSKAVTAGEKLAINEIIKQFDATYSRFRDDSLVSRIARDSPGRFRFPTSIQALFGLYEELANATKGKVSPFVGHSLEQLGYDATYSLQPKEPIAAPSMHDAATLNSTELTTSQPVLLDIGAVGKGYLVDRIAEYLRAQGHTYVVDGGGDMNVKSDTTEIIGLEHPLDPLQVIGTVKLQKGCLCGSAINRRAWGEGLHHIIDATTGKPYSGDIVATWAIADSAAVADGLTTGLFFAEPSDLTKQFGRFTYVIMKKDGTVQHNLTPKVGELFT